MFEDVCDVIFECQQIKDYEGCCCQMQYVGKKMCMLEVDEIVIIQKIIDSWYGVFKVEIVVMYVLECCCEKLLVDDQVLIELLNCYFDVDVQYMCMLICNVCKEQVENKLFKVYCEIFQIFK